MNDIIIFGENDFMYIDFITFSSKDMIVVTSSSNEINEKRIFYGLKENGEYFFKKDNNNEESSLPTTDSKLESANSIFTKNGKEYFLSIGRLESETEIYDFENREIYHEKTSNLFPYLNSNIRGNLLILNKDMNRYLYNIIYSANNDISLIFLRFDLNLNDDNSLSLSNPKEIIKTSFSEI